MSIQKAIDEIKNGKMIIIYDGDEREGEADLLFCARFCDPLKIEKLRKDAGGLICLAIDKKDADKLELPFYTDILENSIMKEISCKKTAYGDKPAFSIAINHNGVHSGITDIDRALTITKFDQLIQTNPTKKAFVNDFYSPGHVFLLIGRGIKNRKGHTELALEMAKRASMDGGMVLCEMLGSKKALSKSDAIEYAKKNNLVFLEGKSIFS